MNQDLERELIRTIAELGDAVKHLIVAVEASTRNQIVLSKIVDGKDEENEDGDDREAVGKHSSTNY